MLTVLNVASFLIVHYFMYYRLILARYGITKEIDRMRSHSY
jgi:hypothetical protein